MFKWDRAQEKHAHKTISIALFTLLLAVNAIFFLDSLLNIKEYTVAVLLFVNVLAIVIIYGIIAIVNMVDTENAPIVKLLVDFLISIVATCIVSVWLISIIFTISLDYAIHYKVAFFSSMVVIALFVYYFFIKDHT